MKFLNKLYSKAIFSGDATMNVVAADLGEAMISATLGDNVVKRLPTATGTVGSLSIFVPVSVSIPVLKTSPSFKVYANRILTNGYIGGTLTLHDDVNETYSIEEVSIDVQDIPNMNGTEPAVVFKIDGNLKVNKDALVGL